MIGYTLLTAAWLALPAVSAFRLGQLDAWWCVASLAPTALVLGSRSGWIWAAGRGVFAALVGVIGLLYAISIDVQGTGFNDQFFIHLDRHTVAFTFRAFPLVAYPALALLGCQVLLTTRVRAREEGRRGAFLAVAVVLVSLSPPVTSLAGHLVSSSRRGVASEELVNVVRARRTQAPSPSEDAGPRNIVLIYMESFESLYLDPELFGRDLAPGLRELMAGGLNFVDMREVPGTGWTMGGIVSSQCGFSLKSDVDGEQELGTIDPVATGGCFARLLSESGYRTVFMGGASSAFAGKGAFLRGNGYDEVLGLDELGARADLAYRNPWGLHDDTLFDLAREELAVLHESSRPFLLTLLTLGTHFPEGFIPRSCEPPEELRGSIRAAIYCSASLIAEFARDCLERDVDGNTLVVLFSDHLTMRVDVTPLLKANRKRRKLSFALLAPWLEPERIERTGTHFDVAPTILEAAGLEDFGDFPLGQSLLSHDRGFVLDQPGALEAVVTGPGS